jgi:hypothetical protein
LTIDVVDPPLAGNRAGKVGDLTAAVIVEPFYAPISGPLAVFELWLALPSDLTSGINERRLSAPPILSSRFGNRLPLKVLRYRDRHTRGALCDPCGRRDKRRWVLPVEGQGCSRWNSLVTSRDQYSLAESSVGLKASVMPSAITNGNALARCPSPQARRGHRSRPPVEMICAASSGPRDAVFSFEARELRSRSLTYHYTRYGRTWLFDS